MVKFEVEQKQRDFLDVVMIMVAANFPQGELTIIEMDLCATHANGNPLDFEKLMQFDEFNFMHDIIKIQRHLDRSTGKLRDFFVPRCSRQEAVK